MVKEFKILETENEDHGFWGTARLGLRTKRDMPKLWKETSILLQKNAGLTPEQTRELLDSRWGRHFVDRYIEELRTNVQTFIETVDRVITRDRIVKDYRYYVDDSLRMDDCTPLYSGWEGGINAIELPVSRHSVTVRFRGSDQLCYGFVGVTTDDREVYSPVGAKSFRTPKGTRLKKLYLVVMGAPREHQQLKWPREGEQPASNPSYPYELKIN